MTPPDRDEQRASDYGGPRHPYWGDRVIIDAFANLPLWARILIIVFFVVLLAYLMQQP
jgi:hypothetical protein